MGPDQMPQKSKHLTLIQECQAHPANHIASLRHCLSAKVPGPEVGMPRSSRDSKASGRNGLRITAFYSSRIISQGLLGSDGGAEAVRTRVWGAVEPTALRAAACEEKSACREREKHPGRGGVCGMRHISGISFRTWSTDLGLRIPRHLHTESIHSP